MQWLGLLCMALILCVSLIPQISGAEEEQKRYAGGHGGFGGGRGGFGGGRGGFGGGRGGFGGGRGGFGGGRGGFGGAVSK